MTDWKFKVFLNNKTTDVIGEWLSGLPGKDRAKIRVIINYLKTTQVWPKSYIKRYVPYHDIYELRIKLYRPLGFFGPGEKEFTLLIGAKEKGDRIEPINAPEIADARRTLILQDRGYINDFI